MRRKVKLSKRLIAQRERFQAAVQCTKRQAKQEESRALYSKGIKGKHESTNSVALGDYLNPPKVIMERSWARGFTRHILTMKPCFLRSGIIAYNVSIGGKNTPEGGYHETPTLFWSRIIRDYVSANKDLPLVRTVQHVSFLNHHLSNFEIAIFDNCLLL